MNMAPNHTSLAYLPSFTDQNPTSEANSRSSDKEIPHIL
jgi:hypothetical protein